MARCERCGNEYERSFDVFMAGATHTFDSFECAIATLAPECSHCGCRIIGHGVERSSRMFCCMHCATHGENANTRPTERTARSA
jgi:hypothetical protein